MKERGEADPGETHIAANATVGHDVLDEQFQMPPVGLVMGGGDGWDESMVELIAPSVKLTRR